LAISRRLAELMGGRMGVESFEGRGSTFSFTVTCTASLASGPDDGAVRNALLRGLRVLVVEDNAASRRSLASNLRQLGLSSTEVESGAEALALLNGRATYDVIMVDDTLAGLEGDFLAGRIRSSAGCGSIPLVLLTSPSRRSGTQMYSACLVKPAKYAALAAALTDVLINPGTRADRRPVPVEATRSLAERCPLKILVADDNHVNIKVAQMTLRRLGYQTDLAANGLEVLDTLERTSYDVIFMDMEMPEMDGLEAARRIRAGRVAIRPWIVALTANAMHEDRDRALQAGMNDFISKPFKSDALASSIETAYRQLYPSDLSDVVASSAVFAGRS